MADRREILKELIQKIAGSSTPRTEAPVLPSQWRGASRDAEMYGAVPEMSPVEMQQMQMGGKDLQKKIFNRRAGIGRVIREQRDAAITQAEPLLKAMEEERLQEKNRLDAWKIRSEMGPEETESVRQEMKLAREGTKGFIPADRTTNDESIEASKGKLADQRFGVSDLGSMDVGVSGYDTPKDLQKQAGLWVDTKKKGLTVEQKRILGDRESEAEGRSKGITESTKEARKALGQYVSDAVQVLKGIDKIGGRAALLPDYKSGVFNQTYAKGDVAIKNYAADERVTKYLGVVAQELIPFARKIMEEKGPIAEGDVKRVEEGLGKIELPLGQKIFLLNELRGKIKAALDNKMESAGMTREEFEGKYKTLNTLLKSDANSQNAYNILRDRGLSSEEAREQLGI